MNKKDTRPAMFKGGKTLFLTIAYPPNPAAAAVVHRHLLDQFDPKSFVVITAFFPGARRAEVPKEIRKYFIYLSFEFLSSKIHRFIAGIQKITIPLFLNFYISLLKPARIIITYPDLYWLDICSAVAIKRKVPFIPYLHDTVVEATYGRSKELAKEVQERIFGKAYNIAVMSEGMKVLYEKKYNLSSIAWEHIYPESPVLFPGQKDKRAHWSGDVYEINYKAVFRFNNALAKMQMQFTISNGKTREQLKGFGIDGNHLEKVFYPKRADYLQQLSKAQIVLLGLNYSDECTVHEDELATIFSTKTPEYLGSDSLIVYHGPRHYFLAQFLLQNDCGIVIDTRDENELLAALKNIIENLGSHQQKIKNARNSLSVFNADLIAQKLIKTLDV
ncbi:MAG: hypothetical protein ABI741_05365 [Ferruginibacter sp.]